MGSVFLRRETEKSGFLTAVIAPTKELGNYIQFYTNGIPKSYVFAGSDQSPPPVRGTLGVDNTKKRTNGRMVS